jgi:hypothetical protein
MDKYSRHLLELGWRRYTTPWPEDAYVCFYKSYPTPTRCFHNPEKEGLSVCCTVSYLFQISYELSVRAGLPDGTTVELHQWSLPDNIDEGLAMIPRMLAAWECMCANTDKE